MKSLIFATIVLAPLLLIMNSCDDDPVENTPPPAEQLVVNQAPYLAEGQAEYDSTLEKVYIIVEATTEDILLEMELSDYVFGADLSVNDLGNEVTLTIDGTTYELDETKIENLITVNQLDTQNDITEITGTLYLFDPLNPTDTVEVDIINLEMPMTYSTTPAGNYATIIIDGVEHNYDSVAATIDEGLPLIHLSFDSDEDDTFFDIFVTGSVEGIYLLDSGPNSFSLFNGVTFYSSSYAPGSGQIEITEIDETNMVIRGIIEGDLINSTDDLDIMPTIGTFCAPYTN